MNLSIKFVSTEGSPSCEDFLRRLFTIRFEIYSACSSLSHTSRAAHVEASMKKSCLKICLNMVHLISVVSFCSLFMTPGDSRMEKTSSSK